MSHFSRIKTSIKNIDILKKTLKDLNFNENYNTKSLLDTNVNIHKVDLVVTNSIKNKNSLGFSWDGIQYNIIADLQLWNQDISFDGFMHKIMQQYALNSIMDSSVKEGFKKINQVVNKDGSVTLIMQRWN